MSNLVLVSCCAHEKLNRTSADPPNSSSVSFPVSYHRRRPESHTTVADTPYSSFDRQLQRANVAWDFRELYLLAILQVSRGNSRQMRSACAAVNEDEH